MNAMKWSLDFILLVIEDALQGVEVLGDVAPKTVTMYFLSVFKSDICFFKIIFWLFWQQINNPSPVICKHFLLLSLTCFLMLVLLENGPSREEG